MPNSPKPTALKLIQGTARKDRMNKNEPKPTPTARIPSPPYHLGTKAKSEWRRIVKELHATGILTRIDLKVFAAYCQAFDDMVTAQGLLRKWNMDNPTKQNVFVSPAGNMTSHPLMLQARQHRQDMIRAAQECGLTPASRTRVAAAGDAAKGEFDDF